MDRTTSAGLWKYGADFAAAGRVVWENNGRQDGPTPAYYLLCHAIELTLKGYLHGRGKTLDDLKRIGHYLEPALREADKQSLKLFCNLKPEHREAIIGINGLYRAKELEYIVAGFKQYPRFAILLEATETLVGGLHEYCRATVDRHKPSII